MSDDITHADARKSHNSDALLNLLYPETIYRFNQAMVSLWKDRKLGYLGGNESKKIAWFVTPYFSAHTRTFHWVNIHPSLWADDEESAEVVNTVLQTLRELPSEKLTAFVKQLPRSGFFQEARKTIEEATKSQQPLSGINARKLKRALLALYSGHHNPGDTNIEGIFVRLMSNTGWQEKCDDNPDLDYLKGTLSGDQGEVFSWFEPDLLGTRRDALKRYENCGDPEKSMDSDPDSGAGKATTTDKGSVEMALYDALLGKRDGFQNELYKRPHACLIPLYDHWRRGKGYGAIKAVLIAFFEERSGRDAWLQEKHPALSEGLAAVAGEIANSAQTMAISQSIEPPYDLLRHFLRILTFVQDWESATVIDERTKKVAYQYRREKEAGSVKWGWELKAAEDKELPSLAGAVKESIELVEGKYFMWWTADLWLSDYITGLGDDELSRFRHMEIRFEFPKASRIPGNLDIKRWLRQAYIRQQLGLLQQLIPKLRTRRAALRSALSAIMGRNMSHNIGSHVLARYSSKAKEDTDPVQPEKADHRGDFLAYLQRRMDFLAEVATSDRAFWSQPLSLKEQLVRLNYGEQKKRFGSHSNCTLNSGNCTHHLSPNGHKWTRGSPILLSFITGKESLLASVEYGEPVECDASRPRPDNCNANYFPGGQDDFLFACPGGEVGVHALYIVLENIIRNSARHGSSSDDTVRLFVRVKDEPSNIDFLTVEIIDPRSRLVSDGSPLVTDASNATPKRKYAKKQITDEIGLLGAKRSLIKDGKRQKLLRLPAEINSILESEPFLDANGGPNPHYWGVREVQVCAHYLRGNSLSDLEGKVDETYPVLQADCHKLPDGSFCLKYTLYLQRAKLMAAVVQKAVASVDCEAKRKKGIALIPDDADLDEIIAQSRGFGFLVYQTNNAISAALKVPEQKAALPVRVLGGLDVAALLEDDEWLESLHRCWAECCRDQHLAWNDKPIYGLAVYGGEALKRNPPLTDSDPGRNGNIGWKKQGAPGTTKATAIINWAYASLNNEKGAGIGAAWIDHGGQVDLRTDGAGFGQAGFKQTVDDPLRQWVSAELARSESPHAAFLNALESRSGWEILAAALPRVAVFDERVQAEAGKDLGKNATLSDVWPCMGVWIPKKDCCNLDAPSFEPCQSFLMEPSTLEEQFPIDVLVIHLTILERLHKEKQNEAMNETLEALINETQAKDAQIVIVTGRGVPSIAQGLNHDGLDQVRYLPISVLLESLTARPSKLALMRALWSAGRPQ